MILAILMTIIMVICLIFYFRYRKTKKEFETKHSYSYDYEDSMDFFISMVALVVEGIVTLVVLLGVLSSFSTAHENYSRAIAEKEGLEFAIQNIQIYTDKIELHNSDIFTQVKEFNTNLTARQAKSHNIFTGWFISDWADNITPIDYNLITQAYNSSYIYSNPDEYVIVTK